jgi:hypothetical protein
MSLRSVIPLTCLALVLIQVQALADNETMDPRGKPKQFEAGKGAMFAVWFERGEWHLAVTSLPPKQNKGQPTIMTGSVWVEGDKVIGDWKALEKNKDIRKADFITPHPNEKGFDFKFGVAGKVDAIVFKGGDKAETIKFKLAVEGRQQPGFVYIGAKGEHPSKAEFTLPARPGKQPH